MKKIIIVLTVMLVSAIFSNSALAYYGSRPMGMGGAFTAIADDATAPLWNPAGLALNPGFDIAYSLVTQNKENVPMDSYLNAKWCLEAELGSPFEWIFGVGFVSLAAVEGARYLADHGVIKRGWGREGQILTEEEDAAAKVKEEGERVETMSEGEKPQQVDRPAEIKGMVGKAAHHFFFNMPWRFKPRGYTYWEVRPYYDVPREYTPLGKAQFAIGATWMGNDNLGASASGEQRNWYALTLATGWEEKVALGAAAKVYALEVNSGGVIKGSGGGLDVGAIIRPTPKISFGVSAQDVLVSDLQWTNGVVNRYQMKVNAGVAIKPVSIITLAADMRNVLKQGGADPTYHYGVEVLPAEGLALRAGLYDNSKTAGFSLALMDFVVDWSYLGGSFGGAHMTGVTWKF